MTDGEYLPAVGELKEKEHWEILNIYKELYNIVHTLK